MFGDGCACSGTSQIRRNISRIERIGCGVVRFVDDSCYCYGTHESFTKAIASVDHLVIGDDNHYCIAQIAVCCFSRY